MLVERIYSLLRSKGTTKFTPEHIIQLAQGYGNAVKRQLVEEDYSNKPDYKPQLLSPSRISRCVRQSYFHHIQFIKEPMHPRANLTFLFGDLVEASYRFLARHSGVELVGSNQRLEIPLVGSQLSSPPVVTGECDDIIRTPKNIRIILEIKSMSGFAWKRFRDEEQLGDSFGYHGQVQHYIHGALACGAIDPPGWALVFGVNKDTGHIAEKLVKYNPLICRIGGTNYDIIAKAVENKKAPPRMVHNNIDGRNADVFKFFDKKIKAQPPIFCQYCPYKYPCWEERIPEKYELDEYDNYEPVWAKGSKPRQYKLECQVKANRFGVMVPGWKVRSV